MKILVRAVCLASALCVAASAAPAQRGGRMNPPGGRSMANLDRGPSLEIPKYLNPIMLIIQHRQDLALSDSQFARVIHIKREIDSTNSPLMRRLDSVQVLFKGRGPLFGDPSAERRDSLSEARGVVRETIAEVRENLSDARTKAYALLSASQIAKAQEFEVKEQRAIEEANQAKPGERGGRGIGASRPPT